MKKVLYALLFTVCVLTMSVGNADAAWTSSFTSAKKILSNAGATKLTAVSAYNSIAYTLGAGETLNTNDVITVTLSGGAKFSSTAPVLKTTGGTAFAAIVGSATGATTANFRVTASGLIPTDVIYLNTDQAIFDVSAVTGNVDVNFKAITAVGSLTIFDSLQSSKTGAKYGFSAAEAMESVTITASTNIADVSAAGGAYKRFTTGLVGAAAGFSITNLCDDNTLATIPAGQQISAGKIVFNINGALTGVTSISGAGCTPCDAAGTAIVGGTANTFGITTAKTNAYCFNTAALAPMANLALAPAFTIDGTTAQTARSFNASVALLADGTSWDAHSALGNTAIYSITRNGSSFVTNSIGSRNKLKITDRSGALTTPGTITITAYAADGTAIPELGSAAALTVPSNGTTEITGADLAARFPTGTPMRYDFAVESASIIATNVKFNADSSMSTVTIFSSAAATATGIGQGL